MSYGKRQTMHIAQVCGAAWSSRWSMMQLTNGQHAYELVFEPKADIWSFWKYFIMTINLLYLYLIHFMFHTVLDAAGVSLRAHYKSMKCDV